jgi:hypothetical protein
MTARRPFTAAEKRAIAEKCGGRCVDCGSDAGPFDHDHARPVWGGGETSVANGVLRCRDCHAVKSAREATARAKADRIRKRLAGRRVGNHQARNRRARDRKRPRELPF